MQHLLRVVALVLLLAATVASTAAFAAPAPAHGALAGLSTWGPFSRLWIWLSGQVAPHESISASPTGRPRSTPKGMEIRPANTAPTAQTDEGAEADPYGG